MTAAPVAASGLKQRALANDSMAPDVQKNEQSYTLLQWIDLIFTLSA